MSTPTRRSSALKFRMMHAGAAALRIANGVGEVVAPGLTARAAAQQWFQIPDTPARRHENGQSGPGGGSAFETLSLGHVIRGSSWGDGPVVYLVHGWAGSAQQMVGLVEPLLMRKYRVVVFDAPSHGRSDPGPSGPGRSHGVEFAHALGAVSAVFGPAHGVITHSLGAMAAMLALRFGSLSAEKLVFLAPMTGLQSQLDTFADALNLGKRTRRRIAVRIHDQVGFPVEEFDVVRMASYARDAPLLVAHDTTDRYTPYADSVRLVEDWPGTADLLTTSGLGHNRLLRDPGVIAAVVGFVVNENPPQNQRRLAREACNDRC
jgi:pimeloyl-ACP methyl ester carboxylesterase